ncbi:MAG: hypothetical protein AABX47_05880 [Nanoarchaeota archaeon]
MYPPDLLKRIEEARDHGMTDCRYTDEEGEEVELHLGLIPKWADSWNLGD